MSIKTTTVNFSSKKHFIIIVALLFCAFFSHAQEVEQTVRKRNSFGFGAGQDYGGFGVNLTLAPTPNLRLFASAGYALVDLGWNAGFKVKNGASRVSPYFKGMYGYNAVIKIEGLEEKNRMFFGPTIGAGVDIEEASKQKMIITFGLNLPIRSKEVEEYIEDLRRDQRIQFDRDLLPVSITIGFQFYIT